MSQSCLAEVAASRHTSPAVFIQPRPNRNPRTKLLSSEIVINSHEKEGHINRDQVLRPVTDEWRRIPQSPNNESCDFEILAFSDESFSVLIYLLY